MERYQGSVAWVTGAASGVGQATVHRLASEGAAVACLDLGLEGAEATAQEARGEGYVAKAIKVDVSDAESVAAAAAEALEELGPPTHVVNCAGIGGFYHSHEMELGQWERILAVNLTGTFLVCRAALPHMLKAGKGSIVNIASHGGLVSVPYSAAYCASKGGVIQLTKALADEYLEKRIRVNAVAPGGVKTPMQSAFQLPEGAEPHKIGKLMSPLGSCHPSEVAALVAYVGSDEAKRMTGSILSLDGGLTV